MDTQENVSPIGGRYAQKIQFLYGLLLYTIKRFICKIEY